MNAKFSQIVLVVVLVIAAAVPSAAAPLSNPCAPGAAYNSACDVDQNGQINITDIQLTAGHWNQGGTFTSDNNHNHLGQTWTGSNNPLVIQGSFGPPSWAPLILGNTGGVGVRVNAPGGSGVWVESAGNNGVLVDSAGNDGLFVCHTGTASTCSPSTTNNGVEIGSAQNNGVEVYSAGNNGFHVYSAGNDGVAVGSTGNNGVYVANATWDGVHVAYAVGDGIYANTTQASGQWGLYTPDAIHGSNVLMHSLSLVAQVAGPDTLSAGDIVAVAGVADPVPGSTVHTPLVRLADGTFGNVAGVVEGRLVLSDKPSLSHPGESDMQAKAPASELRSADGPARAGDYVAITVLGAARVKVQHGAVVQPGQRLTTGEGGTVRALQTRTVEGMVVTEGAPVIGVALEAPKDGMVWVLVNSQ